MNNEISDGVQTALAINNIGLHLAECSSAIQGAAERHSLPSAVYRPSISIDGNQWCALYGENLQDGVAGFGDSPSQAMSAFDVAWHTSLEKGARL